MRFWLKISVCQSSMVHDGCWVDCPTRSGKLEASTVCWRESERRLRPHSIILASCKPGFRPGLQPGFRQVRAGLRHAADQLSTVLSKTGSRTAAGSLLRALARQMKCRKSKFAAGFRHAFNLLATRGFRPGLQLARIIECGLYSPATRQQQIAFGA